MTRPWPENTAEIYRDIAEEERWANAIWPVVVASWPDIQIEPQKKEAAGQLKGRREGETL